MTDTWIASGRDDVEAAPAPVDAAPVSEEARVLSIDVLRGVAVLGILVLNIQAFAMPGAAYMNPTAFGNLTGANYAVWYITFVFGDSKFMTIFSMLFGAGIVLMTSNAERRTGRSAGLHYARMGWLILFGLLHAHLLWYGDILYSYGMCGLLVWLVRRWRPRVLIPLGVGLLAVGSLISLGFGFMMQFIPDDTVAKMSVGWTPTPAEIGREINAYRGTWLDQAAYRTPGSVMMQTFLFIIWSFWRAGGLMLVGMGLFKLGVFAATCSRRFYAIMILAGLVVGLPLVMYGVHRNWEEAWDIRYSFVMGFGMQFNYWGSVLVSLGYVGMVMLACQAAWMRGIRAPFAAVGRMALTNYLMQTVICTTIFYGHGFGAFGSFSRVEQAMTVVGIWVFQLVFSVAWLRWFRFGPAEWLWRSLTYWRWQPFRAVSPGFSG